MINQYMYQAQEGAKNRKSNAISGIIGSGDGAQNSPSTGQDVMSGLSGYLTSDNFTSMFKPKSGSDQGSYTTPKPLTRKGYEPDWMDYNLNNSQWGTS